MYIEEIILDGFKSYQKRTIIGKFDPRFNAITGLNGSGKSNILDSICFVLGISNLSQIRINKLEELVYKSGQAGISKASVSIVFNNEDKSNSSPLYKDLDKITITRQIATGGRNRYLMNGSVVKPIDITNFFHSVQLNVNSSHFLIMQGRITKVINMKPKELLSMIEEAAGTKMYETKKQQSLKLIEKKNSKLEEINRMLEEDIIPKLERLKKEKNDYLKWTSINEEIEFYERLCTLHQFNSICQDVKLAEKNLNNAEIKLDGIEKEITVLKDKLLDIQNIVQDEENKMNSKWSKPLKEYKEKISEIESSVNLTQVQLSELNLDLKDEETSYLDQLKQRDILNKKMQDSKFDGVSQNKNTNTEDFKEVSKKLNDLKDKLELSKKFLQGIRTGCDVVTSNEKSLRQSLFDTEKELANIIVQKKKMELCINDIEKKIKPLTVKLEKDKFSERKDSICYEYEKLKDLVKKLEDDIINLKNDAELCENYLLEKKRLKVENDSLEVQIQPIEMFIRTRQFLYKTDEQTDLAVQSHINDIGSLTEPSKFMKTKVKGSVFELVSCSDAKYSTALEMAAGGRLYNMVVEDSEVGKRLLNSGLIKKRITLIPLDKIIDPSIPTRILDLARKIAHCNDKDDFKIIDAMSVLKYEKEFTPAIKYVFGHTLICENENLAKLITFHPDISVRTVTLKGDIYDPSGTLSGGSIPNNQKSILTAYEKYREIKKKLFSNNSRIEEINKFLTDLSKAADTYRYSQRQLDIHKHQLKLLEEQIGKIKEESIESKLFKLNNDMNDLKETLMQLETKEEDLKENKIRLENEIKNFEATKDSKEEVIEKEIENYKKQIKDLSIKYQFLQKETSTLRIEEEVVKKELEQLNNSVYTKEKNINQIKKNIEEHNAILRKLQMDLKQNKDHLLKLQKEIESSNDVIKENRAETRNIEKIISKKQIEISKFLHEIDLLKTNLFQKNKSKESILRKFDWLQDENSNKQLDFEEYEFKSCHQKLEHLQNQQKSLSKNVNRRILNLYERVNNECNELINKRDIVIKDKDKIEDVINDLDQKKKQALENTWKTVNNSFKSIFNTLLPTANAELVPYVDPDTNIEDFYEGLEFKVELGGIWKKSLSELSGGQKSILALSLILAMLRFKPAPVYILDEIDSALDLSHTQNIGKMIKNHFPNSQFIIVSLKEGMFNKANTLFRTELINGVSTVQKYENNQEYVDENFDDNIPIQNDVNSSKKVNKIRRKN